MENTATNSKNNSQCLWLRVGKKEWRKVNEQAYVKVAKSIFGHEFPNAGSHLGVGRFSGKNPQGREIKGRVTSRNFLYEDYKDEPELYCALMNADLVSPDFK